MSNQAIQDLPDGINVDPFLQLISSSKQRYRDLLHDNSISVVFKNGFQDNPITNDTQARQKLTQGLIHSYSSYAMLAKFMPEPAAPQDLYFNLARNIIAEIMSIPIGFIDMNAMAYVIEQTILNIVGENFTLPEGFATPQLILDSYYSVIKELYEGRTVTLYPSGKTIDMFTGQVIREN